MASKWSDCRRGEDPPKKVLGSTGPVLSFVQRKRNSSSGKGFCIIVTKRSSGEKPMLQRQISRTRSECSSAAMTLSPRLEDLNHILISKGGQISNFSLTGVLSVQIRRRSRRSGDAKTRYRHLRHTCTRGCHTLCGCSESDR
jgi:hypothetical protein